MITSAYPSSSTQQPIYVPYRAGGAAPDMAGDTNAQGSTFKPVQEPAYIVQLSSRESTAERAVQAESDIISSSVNQSQVSSSASAEDGVSNEQSSEQLQQQLQQQEEQVQTELEKKQQQQEQQQIDQLASRDREVRAHEQAHAAVGGQLAGSPNYEYERGPDGVSYAVSGEVPISTGEVPGDPETTLQNAQIVQRAALAPAEPSPQDRAVAAEAAQLEQQAIQEIAAQAQQERQAKDEEAQAEREAQEQEAEQTEQSLAQDQQDEELLGQFSGQTDAQAESQQFDDFIRNSIDLNQRLIDIGVGEPPVLVGALLDLSA